MSKKPFDGISRLTDLLQAANKLAHSLTKFARFVSIEIGCPILWCCVRSNSFGKEVKKHKVLKDRLLQTLRRVHGAAIVCKDFPYLFRLRVKQHK